MTDTERRYHIMYGLHSLIPACCIRFFIDEWDGRDLYRTPEGGLYRRALQASRSHYVQCPNCLGRGNVVKIRNCRTECGRACNEEYAAKALGGVTI